jgi:hypothetical protein
LRKAFSNIAPKHRRVHRIRRLMIYYFSGSSLFDDSIHAGVTASYNIAKLRGRRRTMLERVPYVETSNEAIDFTSDHASGKATAKCHRDVTTKGHVTSIQSLFAQGEMRDCAAALEFRFAPSGYSPAMDDQNPHIGIGKIERCLDSSEWSRRSAITGYETETAGPYRD